MLFASYIRRQHMKFMVRLILLFNICCSLRFILMLQYKRYWYVTSNLDNPLRRVAGESSDTIKVISGAITFTMHFRGMLPVIFLNCGNLERSLKVRLDKVKINMRLNEINLD